MVATAGTEASVNNLAAKSLGVLALVVGAMRSYYDWHQGLRLSTSAMVGMFLAMSFFLYRDTGSAKGRYALASCAVALVLVVTWSLFRIHA